MLPLLIVLTVLIITILPYLIPLCQNGVKSPPTTLADSSRFVKLENSRIHYQEDGSKSNPAVVLIHGFCSSSFIWRHTLATLAETEYHAFAIDLKGFGLSEKSLHADFSHISQATLVGHSVGTNIVLHFAAEHPQLVTNIVLVNGPAYRRNPIWHLLLGYIANFPPFTRWEKIIIRTAFTSIREGHGPKNSHHLEFSSFTP